MGDLSPSIVIDNVSKRFALAAGRPGDLRERFLLRPRQERQPQRDFLALDRVSFEVFPGVPVGVIGHNGSGKSTLLKLLTGILKPTSGRVSLHGRIGALIEVGAGFHPDLTGRENVFLSGSIFGLTRQAVRDRYDQIVDFAGLEAFMETPVKRYSSGMFMRLGFSVIAHLDPEILLIDEVLSVGDALFQAKCVRFLKDFVARGGAVVFVSHVLGQVQELCPRCVWLDHGQARFVGDTADAVRQYLAVVAEREDSEFQRLYPVEWEAREQERRRQEAQARRAEEERQAMAAAAEREERERREALEEARRVEEETRKEARRQDPARARLTGVTLRDNSGVPRLQFRSGDRVRVEIGYRCGRPLPEPAIGFDLFRCADGLHVFTTSNFDHRRSLAGLDGAGIVAFTIPYLALPAGEYRVQVNLYDDTTRPDWSAEPEDAIADAARLTVTHDRVTHGAAFLPVEWGE